MTLVWSHRCSRSGVVLVTFWCLKALDFSPTPPRSLLAAGMSWRCDWLSVCTCLTVYLSVYYYLLQLPHFISFARSCVVDLVHCLPIYLLKFSLSLCSSSLLSLSLSLSLSSVCVSISPSICLSCLSLSAHLISLRSSAFLLSLALVLFPTLLLVDVRVSLPSLFTGTCFSLVRSLSRQGGITWPW
jgi:hypothetical protein